MASPGAVYHPEEIELMTAALDDAVVLANGQRSSAVKVRFARRILASAAEGAAYRLQQGRNRSSLPAQEARPEFQNLATEILRRDREE
jgi:hypothetical protein